MTEDSTLITLLNNESESIEDIKKRSFWLLSAYSLVSGFLLSNKSELEVVINYPYIFLSIAIVLTISCCVSIKQNYASIQGRRNRLKILLSELKAPEKFISDMDKKSDGWIPPVQIFYILSVFLVALLSLSA